MTPIYLLHTTTAHIRYASGLDKEPAEFVIARQIRDLGLRAWAPVRAEFKRSGKDRHASLHESPYLPGYVFAEVPAEFYHDVMSLKGVRPTSQFVHGRDDCTTTPRGQLLAFSAAADEELAKAREIAADAEKRKQPLAAFRPGQALRIIAGPLADQIATFERITKGASDAFPRIRARLEIMGASVPVTIDPLHVAAAE